MPYAIRLPDGTLVENIPDDLDPSEAKRRLISAGLVRGPETTIGGQAREVLKGLPRGAINLVETAALGAANILPQQEEDSAKQAIREFATAVKQPFTAAPGYEDTILSKGAEALGSTLPFFALGPLGAAGRVAATGLAGASGAGEASERAAAKGATAGQQTTATVLGTAVGLSEMLPVFKFLDNLSTPIKEGILNRVRRAAVTGGAEGAQEAAAQLAQNLIAQKIYDPSQAAIEGTGEAGAYGAGVGALIQGITDMALGRRGGGSGVSGQGATIEELRAKQREAQPKEPPSTEYLSDQQLIELGSQENGYGKLEQYKQQLMQRPKSRGVEDAVGRVAAIQRQMNIESVERLRPAKDQQSAFAESDPDLFGMYYPEQQTTEATEPEATPTAAPQEGQQELDFTPEGGTAPLFPEDGYEPAPQDYEAALADTPQEVVTPDILSRIGLQPKQPIYKRIVNKRLDRTSDLEYVKSQLEEYLTKGYGSNELRASLDGYFQNLVSISAKNKEFDFSPPRVRKKGQRETVRPTEPTGAGTTTGPVDATADQPSVGVAVEPDTQRTATAPATEGVGVSEPVNAAGTGEQPREYPALDTRVKTVEADAVDQQREREPVVKLVNQAYESRAQLIEQRRALKTALEDIKTPRGQVLSKNQAAYDETSKQLEEIEKRLSDTNKFIRKFEGKRAEPQDTVTEADKQDRRETVQEVRQRIDQAVGAYNNPKSPDVRLGLSTDYIFDEFAANSKEDLSAPSDKTARAKRDYALNALAYGVEYDDLKPSQRASLAKALGLDTQTLADMPRLERRKAIRAAADEQLGGKAQKWEEQLFYRGETTKTPSVEQQQQIEAEVRKQKDIVGLANWISKTGPEYLRPIAARVRDKLAKMQRGGYTIEFRIADSLPGDNGRPQLGVAEISAPTKQARVHFLSTANSDASGMRYDIILHELVHVATHGGIHSNQEFRKSLEDILKAVRGGIDPSTATGFPLWARAENPLVNTLESVDEMLTWALTDTRAADMLRAVPYKNSNIWKRIADAVLKFFGLNPKYSNALEEVLNVSGKILKGAESAGSGRMSAVFNDDRNNPYGREDSLKSLYRLAKDTYSSEVSPDDAFEVMYEAASPAQKYILRELKKDDFLGFDYPHQAVDAIIEEPEAYDISPGLKTAISRLGNSGKLSAIATPDVEAAAQYGTIAKQDRPTFTERAVGELGANKVLGTRVKLTDSLATHAELFANAWRGRVRDSEGNLNPEILLSRALDALRVGKAVQQNGGLEKIDGIFVATDLTIPENSTQFPLIAGQSVSYEKVIQKVATAAKQEGKTYAQMQEIVDNVLYGRREHELYRMQDQGLGPFEFLLTREQAESVNRAFEANEDLQAISQSLDAIRFNLIDAMVEAGRISPEHASTWKEASGYIPFKRLSDDNVVNALSNAYGANRGVAALRNIKRFKGSDDRKSGSVIENFSGLIDYMTVESMRNDAVRQSLETLELMNQARQVPTPEVIDKDRRNKVVRIYKDGKEKFYYVDDPSLVVVYTQQPATVSSFVKGAQKFSQILRAGVTAAPPFAVKQVFDDIVRAYTFAGVRNPGELTYRILSGFPKNWYNELLGRKSAGVKGLERLGIIGTFDFTESSNLKSIMEESGAVGRGLGSKILRVMEAGAKASDISVREAIYQQTLKETGDLVDAESRAREIINFSRRGSAKAIDYMVRIVPFFNAYARGMDKLAVAAAGRMVGTNVAQARSNFYQRMATLTAMGMTYAILMSDDEEYNALPDHVRDQNWVLPWGKELGFTPSIPIPPELAFFFKAIPERVVQYYRLSGTDEERAVLSVIKELAIRGYDVFNSPNVTPQVLKPILENMANYSFFLGRPLESQSQVANLRPFQRYGTGTSELAKATAEGLETVANKTGLDIFAVSPIKIENMIRGLLGTTAGTVLALTDMMFNPTRTDRPIHSSLFAQATGASALMKDKLGTRFLDDIYDLEMKVEQVYGTFNSLKESNPERAMQFLEDNYSLYSMRDVVKGYMDRIRTINQFSMRINKDTSMSGEEKRQLIDELKEYQLQIARDVLRLRKMAADIV